MKFDVIQKNLTQFSIVWGLLCLLGVVFVGNALAEPSPEMINEAMRKTGLSRQEVLRLYEQRQNGSASNNPQEIEGNRQEPGRQNLNGIDDSKPGNSNPSLNGLNSEDIFEQRNIPGLVLPFQDELISADNMANEMADSPLGVSDYVPLFGQDFFSLDEGLFTPPTFGPVSEDYQLGVGDELVVDVWGAVEFRLSRLVDRDGSVILPQGGKIHCAGQTLQQVTTIILQKLGQAHSSIDTDGPDNNEDQGDTFVDVSLGSLRGIRVYVIGEITRPGSYELSSLSSILGALYAAGGPSETGTLRNVQLIRQGKEVASLDLYDYLLHGVRDGDRQLHDGDTILVPQRGATVFVEGEVNRPIRFEMKGNEGLADLFGFSGGFTAFAAPGTIHIQKVVPVSKRRSGQPDLLLIDVPFDADKMQPVDGVKLFLSDGSRIKVDAIDNRFENWVEVVGQVKQPGVYQHREGMSVGDLVTIAGGLWPDALTERAVIDRIEDDQSFTSRSFSLAGQLDGSKAPVLIQAMDKLQVFSSWNLKDRPHVQISGEVFEETSVEYRVGMTLRDLILKAGGLKQSADLSMIQINRLKMTSVASTDVEQRPNHTVDVIDVILDPDFLNLEQTILLNPHDRISIRKLPWWELQRTVTLGGEVFYPGVFSLERQDERISSVVARAGGLKPDAYLIGARIIRKQDGVGNIAIDLMKALSNPGSPYDLVLQNDDKLLIPAKMQTVKVIGEVGFPTSLVFENDRDIDYYVNRAGGYLEAADEDKSRVVWPNGMSLPNKGDSRVVAGSTIIVPLKAPETGKSKMETMTEITAILAGLATVWLVIDNTSN
ncbi:MAG: hypothetical protein GY780_15345 [bacterium]|nr:hypothetical protein [bacterium]